jgi:hypothetical protein
MQFDPQTIAGLKAVLEEAWASLSPDQQAETSCAVLAERLLKIAATGERDPLRLRAHALACLSMQEAG